MAQERDLPPLSPSAERIVASMLAPWRVILPAVVKLAVLAAVFSAPIWLVREIESDIHTAAFEQSAQEMSTGWLMVMDLTAVVLTVLIATMLVSLMMRIQR